MSFMYLFPNFRAPSCKNTLIFKPISHEFSDTDCAEFPIRIGTVNPFWQVT